MTRVLRLATLLVLLSAVVACGFAPRGSDALPAQMSNVYIDGDKSTRLYKALRDALMMRRLEVETSRSEATAVISLLEEENNQRILSVAATEGPEEFEVFQTVTFSLTLDATPAIEAQRLTLTRGYTYNRNDILGKRHEYESLREALAVEMAQAILRRTRYAR